MSSNVPKIIQLHGQQIIISNTNVHAILNNANFEQCSNVDEICPITDLNTGIVTSNTYEELRNASFAKVKNPTVHTLKRVSAHIIQTDITSPLECVSQSSNSKIKKLSSLPISGLNAVESDNIFINSRSIKSQPNQVIANVATPIKITNTCPSAVLMSKYMDNDNGVENSMLEIGQAHKPRSKSNDSPKKINKKQIKRDEESQVVDNTLNDVSVCTDTNNQPCRQPRFDLADISIDMCRICTRKESLISIFDTAQTPSIVARIKYLANVQICVDDGLPQMICKQCLYKLGVACNFKKLCEFSDLEMRRKTTVTNTHKELANDTLDFNDTKDAEPQMDNEISEEVIIQEYEQVIDNSDMDFQPPLANDLIDESNSERIEECITCKNKFRNPIELQKHIITAHLMVQSSLSEEDIHVCTVCKKEFNSLLKLNAHAIYHNKVKYRCDLCPMTFWGLVKYKRHQRMCHPLQCGECNLTFDYEYLLEQHTRLEHKKLDALFKYVAPVTSTHWSDSDSD